MSAILLRNSSRRKQSGQKKEAKPTSAGRARFQFPGPSIRPSEYPSQSAPISLARKSPLSLSAVSPSLSQETPHGSASFLLSFSSLSPSRPFWPRLSSAPIGPSMAPFVPRGMLRTSIILPDPAGFTDTSQEQMNASHFDGFMNTLGERTGREDLLFSSRSSFYIAWIRPSSRRVSPRRAAVFGLLAPRRSRPNGARRLGELASFESRR